MYNITKEKFKGTDELALVTNGKVALNDNFCIVPVDIVYRKTTRFNISIIAKKRA